VLILHATLASHEVTVSPLFSGDHSPAEPVMGEFPGSNSSRTDRNLASMARILRSGSDARLGYPLGPGEKETLFL
jgi:hypothetical protein